MRIVFKLCTSPFSIRNEPKRLVSYVGDRRLTNHCAKVNNAFEIADRNSGSVGAIYRAIRLHRRDISIVQRALSWRMHMLPMIRCTVINIIPRQRAALLSN